MGTILLEVGERTIEEDLYLLLISLLARGVDSADLLYINLLTEMPRELTQGKEGFRLDVVGIAKMNKTCLLREGREEEVEEDKEGINGDERRPDLGS